MVSREEIGLQDGLTLILRDEKGRVKGTRGMLKIPKIEKTDRLIMVVEQLLNEEEKLKMKEELQEFIVCPQCGFDKFRYLNSGKLHCQKCDYVFELPKEGKKKGH
jgi:rubredoxin